MVYRFHKLPYNYEPGVTRWRHHGDRINACIAPKEHVVIRSRPGHRIEKQELRQAHSAPPQTNTELSSAFTPVTTRVRRSQPLPFISTRPPRCLWYPVPTSSTPPFYDSWSRIISPVTMDAMMFGSKLVATVASDDHVAVLRASPIPVSVIKRF